MCRPAPICTLNLVQSTITDPWASRNFWYMKLSIGLVMEQANPLLESFGESPKACVTNSSYPPVNLKGKENPNLPSVCSNYWSPNVALSLCFNHLGLSNFRKCRSAIPQRSAKPIASIHYTVQYIQIHPQFNVITHLTVVMNQKLEIHQWRVKI